MNWHTEKRKISELKGWESNPRTITEKAYEELKKNVGDLGNFEPLVINTDSVVIAGNQRLRVLKEQGVDEVEVSVPDKELTDEEIKKIGVISNRHSGEWDMDVLANEFEETLQDLGFDDLLPVGYEEEQEGLAVDENILVYNENAIFESDNQYDIPPLLDNKLYAGTIDDVYFGKDDVIENDKTYLALYGQTKIAPHLSGQIVGFYVDDHRFEKVWNNAVDVVNKFKECNIKSLMTPNYSLWSDMPLPYSVFAWYKTMWCGRFWQEAGFDIIPTLNWSDKRSFEFCTLGLPKEIPVATIQIRNIETKKERDRFRAGLKHILSEIKVGELLVYGNDKHLLMKEFEGVNYKVIRSWNEKKAIATKTD